MGAPVIGARPRILFLVTEDWTFWELRRDLAALIQDAGFEVVVATRVSSYAERIRSAGFRLIPVSLLRESRNPFKDLSALFELFRIYRRERPAIVQHVAMKPVLYGSLAAWLARVPIVVNVFGGLGYVFTEGPDRRSTLRRVLQATLRMAIRISRSTVVCQNRDDQAVLLREGVIDVRRGRLIRGSGVDTDRFHPGEEPPGVPVVMLAGRMLWDKGIREFVEAAKRLRQKGVAAQFVLVGRRDEANPSAIDEAQLSNWIRDDGIEWWGHREDMPAVYAQATIVVLPSYREGLPKALLEAAACGKALVATDVPGCREIVQSDETGVLVPVRDADALAKAIERLLADRELRTALGRAARALVVRDYSHRRIAEEFLCLYRDLLSASASPVAGQSLASR